MGSFSPFIYLFNHLFTYSIIYLYQYELMNVYFILWVIIQCYFIYFVALMFPALATGSSFSWLLCPFGIPLLLWGFLKTLPYFLILQDLPGSSSCSSPTISHLFRKSWFLLLENGIKNQDLGTRWVCCYEGVISRPSDRKSTRLNSSHT